MRVSFVREKFKNSENGYCIFVYRAEACDVPESVRGYNMGFWQEITATGYFLPNNKKIEYELTGAWVKTKYGYSLSVTTYEDVVPQSNRELVAYLSSGFIKGIGEKTAKLIVDHFGKNTMLVFDNCPDRLLDVKGIGREKLGKIIESYQSTKVMRDLACFLTPYGISKNVVMRIYKHFGNESMHIVKQDPFKLCEIDGFAFKTVDKVAANLSCPADGKGRIECAITFSLDKAKAEGHLYLTRKALVDKAYSLLNERFEPEEAVKREQVEQNLDSLLTENKLVDDNGAVYKEKCYHAEVAGAYNLRRLILAKNHKYNVTENDICKVEKIFGMEFANKQKEALSMCFANGVSIITGGPGTGKSTILKAILKLYKDINNGKIVLLAPTGKAARRMEECTGIPANTIHSTLAIRSDDDDGTYDIDADFVVVDEFSMVDMSLAKSLFSKIRSGTKLLMIGDPDQLPSVGAGNVFRELINSKVIPTTVLDVVYRQSGISKIVSNAVKINTGNTYLDYDETFSLLETASDEEAFDEILNIYQKEVKRVGIENVQVLVPYRQKAYVCVDNLNKSIQAIRNPPSEKKEICYGNHIFRVGDRIMQIKNNDYASNGETGRIVSIEPDENEDIAIEIAFSSGKTVFYGVDDMDIIDLGYATTVHKSQGSEYKTVIMAMLNSHFIMLKRNLLYTAVTRAKDKVVIVGNKKAVSTATRTNDIDKRNTKLASRLISLLSY